MKSQDFRKWSSTKSRSGCSDLAALKGHGEAQTLPMTVGQEARLEQWLHCWASAVAAGYGCVSQGAAYYKYMAHSVHSNQITRSSGRGAQAVWAAN